MIEVDGGQHAERADHDARRSHWLEAQGFEVMRFWNHQVLTEAVVRAVANALDSPTRHA